MLLHREEGRCFLQRPPQEKISGMIRQPTKKGIRQPQAVTVAAGMLSLRI